MAITNRRQFKAWLIAQLNVHGYHFDAGATYKELREALERLLPSAAR